MVSYPPDAEILRGRLVLGFEFGPGADATAITSPVLCLFQDWLLYDKNVNAHELILRDRIKQTGRSVVIMSVRLPSGTMMARLTVILRTLDPSLQPVSWLIASPARAIDPAKWNTTSPPTL